MGIDFFFVKGLYDTANRQGQQGKAFLEALIDKALNAMIGGTQAQMFSVLISSTIDGKTQQRQIYRDPATLFAEASLALDYYTNGPQGSFGIDYTQLGV